MATSTSMQISKETLSILKNFSQLNSNILVNPGNTISTITPGKNVVAKATIEETFESEFGIWDLGKFLGTISLFDSPSFEFDEKSVKISGSNGSSVTYYYSEPSLLTTINREVRMPETVVSFDFTHKMFVELQRAASVLQLPDLSIRSDGEDILAVVLDKKDPTTNQYSVVVGENTNGASFTFNFKVENIKILDGDYRVDISESAVSLFTHKNMDLNYWIAQENDSTYTA